MNNQSEFIGFDEIDRPESKIIDSCVHCGFCLSSCPTYLETGNELDSPRGRIYLIKSVNEEKISLGDSFVKHLDLCLGCLACETACPSDVKYRNLIEKSRFQIERRYKRKIIDRLHRWLIFSLFPYGERLRLMLPLIYLYNKLGLRKILSSTGILKKVSTNLYEMEKLIPNPKTMFPKQLPEISPAKAETKYRVAVLTGCVQSVFFSNTNEATLRVLTQNGCEVITPNEQSCCGALSIHSGRLDEGRKFARNFIDTFSSLDVDYIIINSAGCGSSVKDYADLLKNDNKYFKKAERISKKTKDLMEFLDEIDLNKDMKNVSLTVTYQDACHISNGQKIKAAPRNVLSKIPGIKFVEMNESDHCCGSAGIYNIVRKEMSTKILNRKINNVSQSKADYILASNPGCLIQIQKGLSKNNLNMKTAHPVEILDMAYTK